MKWNRKKGSVLDVMSVGVCILAMAVIVMAYLNSLKLINTKAEVSQLARKYILRMESVGYLTADDKSELLQELAEIGITEADLSGTTTSKVHYGSPIELCIKGYISGKAMDSGNGFFQTVFLEKQYSFQDIKASTAKN